MTSPWIYIQEARAVLASLGEIRDDATFTRLQSARLTLYRAAEFLRQAEEALMAGLLTDDADGTVNGLEVLPGGRDEALHPASDSHLLMALRQVKGPEVDRCQG